MEVTLYSTGCPKCHVLKTKLDSKNIPYQTVSDVDKMQELGITQVPVLGVDDKLLSFVDAVSWVNNQ